MMKTRKNNELLNLYDEVKNEVKEKEDLLEIICYKEKLEEKIGNNKDIYLRYKILSQGNSSTDIIALTVALISLVVNLVIVGIKNITEVLWVIPNFVNVIYAVLLAGYAIWLMCYILIKIKRLPVYRSISIVLDEIYKERFEQAETHK